MTEMLAIVYNSGTVLWIPQTNYFVRCQLQDDAAVNCTLKSVISLCSIARMFGGKHLETNGMTLSMHLFIVYAQN